MCGIVGYTGSARGGADPGRGASPARVSRLRQRRAGDHRPRPARRAEARGPGARPGGAARDASRRRADAGSATRDGRRTARPPTATPTRTSAGAAGRSSVAVVHNGVIENHASLRRELEAQGFVFASQTDTEVIAHLIARELESTDDLFEAVQRALPRLEGTYGLGVVSPQRPGEVIGARFGSPLVVGLGEGEHLLASDPVAIAPHTARVAFLQDGEVVRLDARRLRDAAPASTGRSRRGSTGSTGSPTRSSWAATPTTCSRRSASSPRRSSTPAGAGSAAPRPRRSSAG